MGLFDIFRRKNQQPASPPLTHPGHRGTGGERFGKPGPHAQELQPGEAQDFLDGELLFVQSSNVLAAQYFADTEKMMVEFGGKGKKASAYLYSDVSRAEAIAFATAGSKGRHIWDYYRIRGTKDGHRKKYVKLR